MLAPTMTTAYGQEHEVFPGERHRSPILRGTGQQKGRIRFLHPKEVARLLAVRQLDEPGSYQEAKEQWKHV